MNKYARSSGFSLIEVMVVLAVLGILAAIAIPSYTKYIVGTHRTTAKAAMVEAAQFMERYYTTRNTYADAALPTAVVPRGTSGANVRYNLGFVEAPDADRFVLQAVPVNAQAADACGTLTLSNTGAQGAGASNCW